MNPSSYRLMVLLAEQAAESRWCSKGEIEALLSDETAPHVSLLETLSNLPDVGERLLKLANSAAHAPEGRVTDLPTAVAHLGPEAVRRLLFTVLLERLFPERGKDWFRWAGKWRHTIALAATASTLAERCGARPQEVFAGALLADAGQLALARWGGPVYQRLEASCREAASVDLLLAREEAVLGFDHAQLGAEIVALWSLPTQIVSLVRDHHRLETLRQEIRPGAHLQRVAILHLAELLVTALGFGLGGETSALTSPPRWDRFLSYLSEQPVAQLLGLKLAAMKALTSQVEERIPELVGVARGREGRLFQSPASESVSFGGAAMTLLNRLPVWKNWLPPQRSPRPRGDARAD